MSKHLEDLLDDLQTAILGGDIRLEVVIVKDDTVLIRVASGEWNGNKGFECAAKPRTEAW